jgi:hypothetical protein
MFAIEILRLPALIVITGLWLASAPTPAEASSAAGTLASRGWTAVAPERAAAELPPGLAAKTGSFLVFDRAEVTLGATGTELPTLRLPLPDGRFERFAVEESRVMSPKLAARYPGIRSYSLRGIDDPSMRGVLDESLRGMHATILSAEETFRIDPLPGAAPGRYMSFREADFVDRADHYCGVEDALVAEPLIGGDRSQAKLIPSGSELRTYRLAVATTGEYYAARGGTDESVLASIVTEIGRVNLVYGAEVAINFTLIANTDDLFWTDGTTDPFTDGTPCTMRTEGANAIDAAIGEGAYDIGHTFGAVASGGCAAGSVVCTAVSKGNGASTFRTDSMHPSGHEDFGGYRLVMHEMAHQFGAGHTWNGNSGNCTNAQYAMTSAYEPSSGTTLMSYSGTCGVDNIQGTVADPYFHTISFDQIVNFSTLGGGDSCAMVVGSGNSAPVVDAGPDYTIPWRTPFVLSGSATDPDGDSLTYTWEQFDQAAGRLGPLADDGIGPLFRSFPPGPSAERTFPQLSTVLSSGANPVGERLPGQARTMNFRLTARDNRSTGGVDYDTMSIDVVSPNFSVLAPGAGDQIESGCVTSVEWSPGTEDLAADVNILFSEDGGQTFTPLLMGTPNDGQEDVQMPCTLTTQGRIKVEAVGNIFFNISNNDFEIVGGQPFVDMEVVGGPADESCTRLVTFEGTATDNCGLDAEDVDLGAMNPDGNALLGAAEWEVEQVNDTTLFISGSVLVSELSDCPAQVQINTLVFDACNDVGVSQVATEVTDEAPPTFDVTPSDLVVECDAVPPPAVVTAVDGCGSDPDVVFEEIEIEGDCPGNSVIERIWTATDSCGNVAQQVQVIVVQDTTPPEVLAVEEDLHCLKQRNHRMVEFQAADFSPVLSDNCSEPITWSIVGCASDQPDDANGDGNTDGDCEVADDGQSFRVRAERDGGVPEGRRYSVTIEATDACGNSSAPVVIGKVHVPHDGSSDCPGS